ncbi:hypothetical protein M513_08207 [Trichuris suis]|uniref:RBR-type E3 ubiquitin transferase n=1 Tax=Trichuris suis TaxID=68888 RepID=A0A085M0Z8_9BILA|nr:hypothetical protein M513_08207 [Trichuris suis]
MESRKKFNFERASEVDIATTFPLNLTDKRKQCHSFFSYQWILGNAMETHLMDERRPNGNTVDTITPGFVSSLIELLAMNIEKRREKSRNDARYRRRSEARIFTELCHILPLTKEPTFYHLDRIAVLRVAVAMCRLRAVTANMFRQGHSPLLPGCARWYNEEDLSELLDGAVFLIVDLRSLIVYVSSSVVETIGMTQERSHMRKCRASAETAFDARDGHKTSLSDVVDLDGTAVRLGTRFYGFIVSDRERAADATSWGGKMAIGPFPNLSIGRRRARVSNFAYWLQTDLIGRQLCDYVHPEDAAELQMVMQWCTVRGEERELVLRVRSALSPRGRSLSLKSSLYKTFSFVIKSTNTALYGDFACKAAAPVGANQHGFIYGRNSSSSSSSSSNSSCWPHQSFSDACLLMFGRAIMHSGHAEGISSELVMTRHTMDMQIYYIDQRLEDLLGYDVKKFRGLSYYGLVHPEDMKMFSGSMRQLYAKGKATTGYYRLMTRQGSVLWLLTESAVITETTRGQRSQRIHCLHRMLMHAANNSTTCQHLYRPECLKERPVPNDINQSEDDDVIEHKSTKESKSSSAPVVTIYDSALPVSLRSALAKKRSQMFANDYEATISTFNGTEPTSRLCSMHFTPFSDLIGNDKEYNWIGGAADYEMKKKAEDEKREEKDFSRLSQLSPFVNYEDLMELHSEGYNVRLCLQGQEDGGGQEWMAAAPSTTTATTTTTATFGGANSATIRQPAAPMCALNDVPSTAWISSNEAQCSGRQMVDNVNCSTTTTTTTSAIGKSHSVWTPNLREKAAAAAAASDTVTSDLISLETASLLESAMMTLFQTESLQLSHDYRLIHKEDLSYSRRGKLAVSIDYASIWKKEETYDNNIRPDDIIALCSDDMGKNDCKNAKDGFEVLQSIDVHNIMLEEVAHASRVTLLPEAVVRFMLERCRWDVNHFLSSYYENGNIDALCQKWKMRNPMAKSDVQLESDQCGICYASQGESSSSSPSLYGPQCGHYFCSQCWQQYAVEKMGSSVGGLVLTCPAYGCDWPLDDRFVISQLANEEQRQRYLNLVTRTFIKVNSKLKQCPQTNCPYLLHRREGCLQKAVCKCGYEFCFNCCQEWHEPLECHLLKRWIAKCETESDSAHWIADYTRPCPRCNTNIEKSGGCNHMKCTQPFCQFEFCWTCQGAWSEHGDEYYVCTKVMERQIEKPAKEGQKFFSDVYAHNFKPGSTTRRFYEFSLQYKKQILDPNRIKRLNQAIERNVTALRVVQNVRWIDTVALEDSVETLKRCMRTIKYTIVFIYYLRPNVWVQLAKGHEDRLDENCKRLLDLLEYGCRDRKGKSLLLWRQNVVDERARCLKFEKALLDFCREGYNDNRWKFVPDENASRRRA